VLSVSPVVEVVEDVIVSLVDELVSEVDEVVIVVDEVVGAVVDVSVPLSVVPVSSAGQPARTAPVAIMTKKFL
jgi:hypothetical protein